MATNEALGMFDRVFHMREMNPSVIQNAQNMFEEYKKRGIIVNCNFEDAQWFLTDEYRNIGMYFSAPEITYRKYYYPIYQISSHEFILYVKSYVMMLMGTLVLGTIRTFLHDLHKLLKYDPKELLMSQEMILIHTPSVINEFFSMLPPPLNTENADMIMMLMEKLSDYRYSLNNSNEKRSLADFSSYFLFNDILEEL